MKQGAYKHVMGTFVKGDRTGHILQELVLYVNVKGKMLKKTGKKCILKNNLVALRQRKLCIWVANAYLS